MRQATDSSLKIQSKRRFDVFCKGNKMRNAELFSVVGITSLNVFVSIQKIGLFESTVSIFLV